MINILLTALTKGWRIGLFLVALSFLFGCSSSGPKTKFYGLFPLNNEDIQTRYPITTKTLSIGIGPIILPDYLINPAIITRTQTQHVRISGYHAWAGDLQKEISRISADNLSSLLNVDSVWAFPWDTRDRPRYQIRVIIEELSGILGGNIELRVKSSILDTHSNTPVLVKRHILSEATSDESFDAYVFTLNALINNWTILVAQDLQNLKSIH